MRPAHGTQGGAQEKRPASTGFQNRERGLDDGLGIGVVVRIGKAGRRIEQRLLLVIKGTIPEGRIGLIEAHFGAVVTEIALHGQRRRGEDPGTRMTAHLLLHDLGDHQRRGVELQRMRVSLAPTYVIAIGAFLPAAQLGKLLAGAAPAVLQTFRALRLRFEQSSK